jgi:hypothetical protein
MKAGAATCEPSQHNLRSQTVPPLTATVWSVIPLARDKSATLRPASPSLTIARICSSEICSASSVLLGTEDLIVPVADQSGQVGFGLLPANGVAAME